MNSYRVSDVFRAMLQPVSALRVLAFITAALVLSGCSSSMTRVQTWEGEAATDGSALLKAPGEIRVASVNGRRMGNFLMDDLALDYDLLPGENQVVFSYKTIWARAGVVRNGESKVHVVETEPHAVTFTAQAGETYRFEFEKPESRGEAEALTADFSGAIVNSAGDKVATFVPWDDQPPATPARTPVSGESPERESAAAPGDNLEQLKSLWENASEEEKRAFLRWAFE
ncbi:MAG: DUF2057 family protein [Pseudomonadota bacterium]